MKNDLALYFSVEAEKEDIPTRKPPGPKLGGFDFLILAYFGLYTIWRLKNA